MPQLEEWFLNILACPRCHTKVELREQGDGLLCSACQLVYPIVDGIPQMLPESGLALAEFEKQTGGSKRP